MPPEFEPMLAGPSAPVSDRAPITFLRITVEIDPASLDRAQANEALRLQSSRGTPPAPVFGGPSSESIAKEVLSQFLNRMPELVQAVKIAMDV